MGKIKIATVCSGIGAPEKALKRLGMDFELAYWCEVDKYAAKAYEIIHNADPAINLGDLTAVDPDKLPRDLDLFVGGTPCQDFSTAGKGAGGVKDSGTRSSLMWYFVEIVKKTRPRALLWENVPGVLTDKHRGAYAEFQHALFEAGYRVYAEVLNAKYFGIPQSRERVFVLAVRRDLDRGFLFPEGYDCGVRLKHVLERDAPDKYYLSSGQVASLLAQNEKHRKAGNGFTAKPKSADSIADCIRASGSLATTDNIVITDNAPLELTSQTRRAKRVYDAEGIAIAQSAVGGGGGEKTGLYVVPHGFNKGGLQSADYCPVVTGGQWHFDNLIVETADGIYSRAGENFRRGALEGFSRTIKAQTNDEAVVINDKYIRRLTPLETTRLFGFDDADYYLRREAGISDTQIYKQNGNSIVVNVLTAIFGELYGIDWRPSVYGEHYKDARQRAREIPLLRAMGV